MPRTNRGNAVATISRPNTPPPPPSSPQVRRQMVGNRGTDTGPERAVRSHLHQMGLRFRKHVRPLAGLRCTADVVFPREKVAVFIDGCFWHGCPEHGKVPSTNSGYWGEKLERNMLRDRRNARALDEAGWLILRYWEHERFEEVAAQVREKVLERRRGPA